MVEKVISFDASWVGKRGRITLKGRGGKKLYDDDNFTQGRFIIFLQLLSFKKNLAFDTNSKELSLTDKDIDS